MVSYRVGQVTCVFLSVSGYGHSRGSTSSQTLAIINLCFFSIGPSFAHDRQVDLLKIP